MGGGPLCFPQSRTAVGPRMQRGPLKDPPPPPILQPPPCPHHHPAEASPPPPSRAPSPRLQAHKAQQPPMHAAAHPQAPTPALQCVQQVCGAGNASHALRVLFLLLLLLFFPLFLPFSFIEKQIDAFCCSSPYLYRQLIPRSRVPFPQRSQYLNKRRGGGGEREIKGQHSLFRY